MLGHDVAERAQFQVGTHYPGMFVVAGSWILVNMVTLGIWLLSTVYTVYEVIMLHALIMLHAPDHCDTDH